MTSGKTLLALITGLVAGAALGILFAPGKGSETRRKLSGSVKDFGDQGMDAFNDLKSRVKGHTGGTHHAHRGNGHSKKTARNI